MTADKVRVDGFYAVSSHATTKNAIAVDAAVIVHGLSGNFYKSRLLKHFAATLVDLGVNSLLVNTRGHDFLNSTPRMGQTATLGAAVEIIDECRHDLYAWVQFLVDNGNRNILLLGHSLGAIKSLYSQAHQPHANVAALGCFSATKLSYDSLLSSKKGDRFSYWLSTAQQLVSDGKGDQLIHVDFPFPTWMSAGAYLKKYGDGDKYNWLSFVDRIRVPTLAVFGEIEMHENPAFVAMAEDLDNLQQENIQIAYVPGADHFYSACFDKASEQLVRWLNQSVD